MKKIFLLCICGISIFLYSCQKEEPAVSLQKVELELYTYENSATPVNLSWTSRTTGSCKKILYTANTEKFYINQDDTIRIQLIPQKVNSFLNVYFKLIINDVTVRTAKLYNDMETNTDTVELVYYIRSFNKYNVSFAHQTNDENDDFSFLLTYCVNDSVCSNLNNYTFDAKLGDLVSSKVVFRIPTSDPIKPVFHKTTIAVNGEIVRHDYIVRGGCGSHISEMTVLIEPYL